jgi:hypothetical protein
LSYFISTPCLSNKRRNENYLCCRLRSIQVPLDHLCKFLIRCQSLPLQQTLPVIAGFTDEAVPTAAMHVNIINLFIAKARGLSIVFTCMRLLISFLLLISSNEGKLTAGQAG